jgi:hypothetical protein
LPLLRKTPFVLDPRPLEEATSSHAGLLSVSRAYRSLGLPALIEANLSLRQRQRGFREGQMIKTGILLQIVGGECPEDILLLANDSCLERGLGYCPPKATALREFLELFHDKDLEKLRPARADQKSFIFPASQASQGFQQVLAGSVQQIAKRYAQQGQPQRIATVDQDATIIGSHKRNALWHYAGGRGYQPMVALWAELDLVLADEFRDGNVPAKQEPLTCAKLAFTALPGTISQRYFRGDSACHENELLDWLKSAGAGEGTGRTDRLGHQGGHERRVRQGDPPSQGERLENLWAGGGRHVAAMGGGPLPSQRFGVNAAWFKLSLLASNVVSAMKGLCLEGEEHDYRMSNRGSVSQSGADDCF